MTRIQQQQFFLTHFLQGQAFTLTALAADASFRRYYRVVTAQANYLLMDAPPALEDSHGFVAIAASFRVQGILTPQIFASDLSVGLLLLEDFGDGLLSLHLNRNSVASLYQACFVPLLKIQQIKQVDGWQLPRFDERLASQELTNCHEWFIEKFLSVSVDSDLRLCLDTTFALLITDIKQHPQVCVHRDYHSRNLMLLNDEQIGVLDFQDAVIGSIAYDLVSLLRDCYVAWPLAQVQAWVAAFYQQMPEREQFSLAQFQRWFDWQGLQRHLKCLFIFARKWLRDGSKNYLPALLTTFTYVETVVNQYPEFSALATYLPLWREKMVAIIQTIDIAN